MGEYYRGIKGDTRSSGYSSCGSMFTCLRSFAPLTSCTPAPRIGCILDSTRRWKLLSALKGACSNKSRALSPRCSTVPSRIPGMVLETLWLLHLVTLGTCISCCAENARTANSCVLANSEAWRIQRKRTHNLKNDILVIVTGALKGSLNNPKP